MGLMGRMGPMERRQDNGGVIFVIPMVFTGLVLDTNGTYGTYGTYGTNMARSLSFRPMGPIRPISPILLFKNNDSHPHLPIAKNPNQ